MPLLSDDELLCGGCNRELLPFPGKNPIFHVVEGTVLCVECFELEQRLKNLADSEPPSRL
jgi:hypothetical protein